MTENPIKKAIERCVELLPDGKRWQVMEVCGTHTMSIARMGIRTILGEKLRLVSGPGCPVCVTSEGDIVRSIHLAGLPGVIVTTFGDMMRVPGGGKSLFDAKAGGADVRIIYSPTDSLKIAEDNPDKQVVFLAVGFETTIPSIAATVELAGKRNLSNFSILPMMKLVPPALRLLCEHPELAIDGFILPGHVSTIIGHQPYRFIVEDFGIPSVITGFTDRDIADGLLRMSAMLASGAARLENSYARAVPEDGNSSARALMEQVFEPANAYWRGVGELAASGLNCRNEYARFDARTHFELPDGEPPEPPGCLCGAVILGKVLPTDCPQFGKSCAPENPLGPCMVSSEGACAAYHKYGFSDEK
ncbi:hydrogenase formation protein HypD [bacterium]|nr:MAG: hydrogenase formation protein HypD [bacterium]